jgi:lycopene beta-cyclase
MMDARCAQLDGYRFFYVLPLSPTRLLVEETRFSLTSSLSLEAGRAELQAYAARFGEIVQVVREEIGVLPMPWSMDFPELRADRVLVAGYRGGFFHPATGYSLPMAVRFAESLCKQLHHGDESALPRLLHEHRSQATFALHLNRLLFTGFAETDMWGVLARFYRFSEPLIERFYALSSTNADRVRILSGWPPRGFSLVRALSAALRAA